MVGMHVGDDDPQYGQAFQLGFKNLLPLRPGLISGNAAVHYGPTLTAIQLITQQPQVDVVQCKGQRHADPLDPRGHFHRCTRRWHVVAVGVVEFLFECVHVGCGLGLTFT